MNHDLPASDASDGTVDHRNAPNPARRRSLRLALGLPFAAMALTAGLAAPGVALAAKDKIYTSLFSSKAAGGYDVVAYFTDGKPVKGDAAFSTRYQDADWLFASQAHLDAFLAEPERYAPQYGGYCAYAVANGTTAKGDPEQWTIHDGKLYLNYDEDIRHTWEGDKASFIDKANALWPTVLE